MPGRHPSDVSLHRSSASIPVGLSGPVKRLWFVCTRGVVHSLTVQSCFLERGGYVFEATENAAFCAVFGGKEALFCSCVLG